VHQVGKLYIDVTKLIVAFRNFRKALKNCRQMEILNTWDKRGI